MILATKEDIENLDFSVIYQQHFKTAYLFVFKRIGNRADAEDIVADSFAAAFKNWPPSKHYQAWLWSIVRHKLTDFLRRKYQLHSTSAIDLENIPESDSSNASNQSDTYLTFLEKLVAELSAKDKQFYTLRYREKFTFNQIATQLNITENNAKVINNRIVKKLKTKWENLQVTT